MHCSRHSNTTQKILAFSLTSETCHFSLKHWRTPYTFVHTQVFKIPEKDLKNMFNKLSYMYRYVFGFGSCEVQRQNQS